VVHSQAEFDKYFGAAKTMKNEVDAVNFEDSSVVAIMARPATIPKSVKTIKLKSRYNVDLLEF